MKQWCLGLEVWNRQKLAKHLLAETWFCVAKPVAGSSYLRLKFLPETDGKNQSGELDQNP